MWGKPSKKGNLIIVSVIISCLLIGLIISAINSMVISPNENVEPETIIPAIVDEPVEPTTEPIPDSLGSRLHEPGELIWSTKLSSDPDEAMLSTPAITDLNPPTGGQGKKFLEVVVGCTDDHIYAVDHTGKEKWAFGDCTIDDAETVTNNVWPTLDFDPPCFFSSVSAVDIAGSNAPELLMGVYNGIVCLNSDGSTHWTGKGRTEGPYFSSIGVTDLEGDFEGIDAEGNFVGHRDDLEIILGSDDDADAQGWLECWQANGQDVFRYQVELSFEHSFIAASIVTTEMDGYFQMEDGPPDWVKEDAYKETLQQDILTSTHGYTGRVWQHQAGQTYEKYHEAASCGDHFDTHQNYATPAVGNFTGGPELEVVAGYGSGHNWLQCDGGIVLYNEAGTEVTNRFPIDTMPGAVYSSPAVCDAQNFDEKDLPEDMKIDYEAFFGSDNGYFYCIGAGDLKEIWSYHMGERCMVSPAICNINSDDSLEVIIASDNGKVYCFEADPKELDINLEPHPKDDGVKEDGGEAGTYDLLWEFDTKTVEGSAGAFGVSSPVVGDINYDGQLEVLIGDKGGTLYCISAGGKCVPGQVDWPKFHGDLNNTGFYNPGTSYGVTVEPQIVTDPVTGQRIREELRKSVKPGEEVTYNLTLTNIGTSKTFAEADTFWIHVNQLVYKGGVVQEDNEWPAPQITGESLQWSGHTEGIGDPYVVLMSFQQTNITLTVPAPWSGDLSEFTQIEVEANSSMDPWARDSVQTTTSLEIFLDFELDILKEPVQDPDNELFGQKVIKINPSDRANIEVNLKNTGNLNDSYDLRLENVLFGWDAFFVKSESSVYPDALHLDAPIMKDQFPATYKGSEDKVAFTIQAPADAQENENLWLKVVATSKYSQSTNLIENITKYDYLLVQVNPVPSLELDCKNPRQYVTAGQNVTFEIEVINRGNTQVTVKLEHSQLEEGWSVGFANDLGIPFTGGDVLVDVMNDGVTTVNVRVHAPTSAAAGSRQNIIIRGTTVTEGEITLQSTDTVALTAIVSQFFDINVTVRPLDLAVDPGEIVVYNITVRNLGNGDDFVIIMPSLLEVNWDSTFYLGSEEKVTAELDYNTSVMFQMQIKIPKNQLAGKYKTGINVSSIGDREIVYFDTIINQIYNLSVFGVVHSDETSDKVLENRIKPEPGVSPGSILNYVFEVTNGGNAPDEVKLELSSTGEDWGDWEGIFLGITNTEAYMTDVDNWDFANRLDMSTHTSPVGYLNSNEDVNLHEVEVKLGVGQKVWVKIQLTVPRDIPTTDTNRVRSFKIHGESLDPEGILKDVSVDDNDVSMVLTLLFPDLEITSGIRHPSKIDNGDIVTISAEITNSGDIEAKDVLVTFYVDGKEVKTQTINLLPKDSTRLIPFTWEAMGDKHTLTIKVDPENAIVEKFENNNEKSKDVNVGEDLFGNIASNRVVCSLVPVIIVAIILAIIVILIKKRKQIFGWKPGGGEEL
ncbi:CARDB domain-containing protein [[Eubacterium] cellulosolvens]